MKNLLIKLFIVSMTILNIAPFTFKAVHAEKANVRTHHVQQLIDIQSTVLPIKTLDEKLEEDRANRCETAVFYVAELEVVNLELL